MRCSSHPNTHTGGPTGTRAGVTRCVAALSQQSFSGGLVLLPFWSHSPNILLLTQTYCIPIQWSPNEEMQSYRTPSHQRKHLNASKKMPRQFLLQRQRSGRKGLWEMPTASTPLPSSAGMQRRLPDRLPRQGRGSCMSLLNRDE